MRTHSLFIDFGLVSTLISTINIAGIFLSQSLKSNFSLNKNLPSDFSQDKI